MAETHPKKALIRHLQAFRGFAIVSVVALHGFGDQVSYFGGAQHSRGVALLDVLNEAILHDSTTYFALISGLLFPIALRTRGWATFFRGRAFNVLAPYVVMSILFTLWNHFDEYQPTAAGGRFSDYAGAILGNLVTGRAYYHLWYIPIVIVLSILTPPVAWLCDRPRWQWMIWLIILLPLVASRTALTVSLSSVGYFLGSYCAGMLIGSHYESALSLFRRHIGALLAVAALSTMLLLAMYRTGFEWVGFVSARESVFYVQKLAIAALVIVWFRANELQLPQWLMTAGTFAFPIFFLHAFFLTQLARGQALLGLAPTGPAGMLFAGVVLIAVSTVFAVGVGRLAQRLLGKYSRAVIGA